MSVTKEKKQRLRLQKKVKDFFHKSMANRKKKGFCITRDVMALLMDKWTLLIMYNLSYRETMRFGELKIKIKGISPRMLSVTLKKLTENKLVERKSFNEVPPRVEYRLTKLGVQLAEKSLELNEWFLENQK